MLEVLRKPDDAQLSERIRGEVKSLCEHFPVPAAAIEEASLSG
jgi:hypothetical protein